MYYLMHSIRILQDIVVSTVLVKAFMEKDRRDMLLLDSLNRKSRNSMMQDILYIANLISMNPLGIAKRRQSSIDKEESCTQCTSFQMDLYKSHIGKSMANMSISM